MEVTLSYEPWGYKDVNAVIDSVGVDYHYDETYNCGVFHPIIVCYVGKCRITFNGPSVWETLVIKPCRKVYVKDLRVGDVVEHGYKRGFVKFKKDTGVTILWFTKDNEPYSYPHTHVIKDAEIVGHVDLWNL